MKYLQIILYSALLFGVQVLPLTPAKSQTKTLTLQDAIDLALKHNRSLKVSDLDKSRAQQQVRIARSRALPAVNVGGQYAYYFQTPVFFGFGEPGDPGSEKLPYSRIGGENQFVAAASLVQPLYDPALRPELQAARLSEDVSQLAYRNTEIAVIAQVKQTYLTVLVLDERLKLQRESLNRNKKVLEDAKSLYGQGRALRVDTLRAYATVKNLQPDITRLSDAIVNTKFQLVTLMGLGDIDSFVLSDSLFIQDISTAPTEEDVYVTARNLRPDLQILSLREEISDKQISSARAGKLPSVSLVGQYQVLTQTNSFPLENGSWPSVSFVGANVSIPVFNGYKHSAKVSDAKLLKEQSATRLEEAQEQLKVDVHRVVSDLHETAERLETQITVREAARQSYDIIQYRYQKGVASRLELTDAELALTTAELNYLEAVYDYLSANIQLDLVVGRGVK